jgi:hypothetical protein
MPVSFFFLYIFISPKYLNLITLPVYLPPKNNRNISFSESGEYEEAEASFYWGLNVPREAFENGADPRNIENKREFLLEYIRDWAPE